MISCSVLHEIPCQYQIVDLGAIGVEPPQQRIAYRRQGSRMGSGIPIVMLHGFLGESTNWQQVAQGLVAQSRVDVDTIRVDLLGFGESGKPSVSYTVAQEVEVVRQLMVALGLKSCYVVGHSFGGWVAAALAIAHPERVRGLCLVAPAGIRDDSFCGRYDHLRPLLWQTPVIDWALAAVIPLAHLMGRSQAFETIAWARRELNRQPAARSFLLDRLRPEDAIDTVDNEIHQIRTPTLILAAENDDTIPFWHCETYAQTIPGAILRVISETSHGVPQNNPKAVIQALLEILCPDAVCPDAVFTSLVGIKES